MKFYTADLHFDHENIIKYCNRPFSSVSKMNEMLIGNWNAKVTKKDEVFILGDFTLSNRKRALEILPQLKGRKHLILGNHDHFARKKFDNNEFVWIKDYAMIKDGAIKVVLSHYPMISWDHQHYGSIHLFGHVHNSDLNYGLLSKKNMFNVGVDVQDFEPKTLEEIMS